ncbi:hypothetical protein SAMN05444008_10495 [Cnuella takakiae]|uniref:Uncharacterized protein n=1 Tax=Cnuella takakiae TaxID=1302690 RepID=A0A1M4XZB2_9BACT|nr:ankyrin repeat domain-containing protein [Cnuella takakiae]OLY92995.1 hypothetical protein BUE76_14650 [Cnuella takakiae]SHE98780.1 hypothetical protein SAMN05444008_10495 [Cnuella takakiae]
MNSDATSQLFEACRRNDVATVSEICQQDNWFLSVRDAKGFTPVLIAVYNNAPAVVAWLLSAGAPGDTPDMSGNTALMGAAFKGYKEMVAQLLQAGVDVNQRNGNGATALTFAATFGQMEIAELLLENGASLELLDGLGKSPIDHAVVQENEPMVRLLEKYERMRMSGQSMLGDN